MAEKGARILIIDDETQMRRLLRVALDAHGFDLEEASSGREGLEKVAVFKPDLVVLDMGLPDLEGIEIVRRVREWSPVPIIILSVRDQEHEKVAALDSGADDYVTKPFGMGELLARIRTALRHAASSDDEPILSFGDLVIDLAYRQVSIRGEDVRLTPTEYELLKNLALHRGKVLTQRQLLRTVWGPGYEQEVHYLRVYIGQLRHKIEDDPSRPGHLITEPGVGYRLV
jgi:two-component system KDP operon response regulator KdpE